MDQQLPVYQYPSLTVLVDDSQSFLNSLVFQLHQQLACKVFYEPHAAIDWLRHAYRNSADQNEAISVGYEEESGFLERRNASIYLDRIYRVVMERQRFNIPAVLVVDYAMPQMNGVEFCRAIRDLPCKKIMLTGQADESIAIDAFNRKLIDCFIRKNDADSLGRLGSEIIRLQKDYFEGRTRTLKDLLSRHSYTFLTDPVMSALTEQLCSRYRFVEYYLFPNPHGILFFDIQGKATLMVVETAEGLTTHYEIAQDQGAPPDLLAALKELRLVPFFSDTGGMYMKELKHDWLPYCLPPQICRGREDYYWALFDLPSHYLPGPVYSYAEYLLDQAGNANA